MNDEGAIVEQNKSNHECKETMKVAVFNKLSHLDIEYEIIIIKQHGIQRC